MPKKTSAKATAKAGQPRELPSLTPVERFALDLLVDLSAVLPYQGSSDAVRIDVQFADLDAPFVFFGDRFHRRCQRTTWRAPRRPEINQDGRVRLYDFVFKVGVCDFDCIGAHDASMREECKNLNLAERGTNVNCVWRDYATTSSLEPGSSSSFPSGV